MHDIIDSTSVVQTELKSAYIFIAQKPENLSGSETVRMLLKLALDRLNISDTLNESTLPYRLQNSKKLVSFSHSSRRIAVAIAKTELMGLGIDIEDNDVSMKVAKRFFAPNEVSWLETLTQHEQKQATNLLWMTKEALIKAQPSSHSGLLLGMKKDVLETFELSSVFLLEHKSPKPIHYVANNQPLTLDLCLNYSLVTAYHRK